MRRRPLSVALAVTASLVVLAPAGPAAAQTRGGARGSIILEGLTLAGTQFGTPSGLPTTVATDPLQLPLTTGDHFLYSTITCASPFPPWNNVGLHFNPDYPGITDPASVRHEFEGTVLQAFGDRAVVEGTITSYLCENGVRTDQIVTSFRALVVPTSATSVPLTGGGPVPTTGGLAIFGTATITGGTGRFADIRGSASLMGQFTCLPASLVRNGVASCAALGGFSESPFQLRGSFTDPTVPTA